MTQSSPTPSLPQTNTVEAQGQRALDVRLARTAYNYMFSYLEPLPLSANVPQGEGFDLIYDRKIAPVLIAITDNLVTVVRDLLGREFKGCFDQQLGPALAEVSAKWAAVKQDDHGVHLLAEPKDVHALLAAMVEVLGTFKQAVEGLAQLPGDLESVLSGIKSTFEAVQTLGRAAFLKFGVYDLISPENRPKDLAPTSYDDYALSFQKLGLPQTLRVEAQPWMQLAAGQQPWQQDWFFGYQQIAGYNTTMLNGVTTDGSGLGIDLQALLAKFPITDQTFQSVLGDNRVTLESAAAAGRLYVCDYAMLEGVPSNVVYGQRRTHGAPIALFYWNSQPPAGYPPLNQGSTGVMQPIAIQIEQTPNPTSTPIFTPRDGNKWTVAKYFVQSACAIEHETIAHLGECHLTIEPMVVAAHRQLSVQHPILILLLPHFRFTLAINADALGSLVIPDGVLSVNLSPTTEGSMGMVRDAHLQWRFDQQRPTRLFERRAVGSGSLPQFPFRDDTLLLWSAIETFVGKYLKLYYSSDADLLADYELQAWINEMVSPQYASVKGMDGLVNVGSAEQPKYQIQSLDYLTEVLAQIIYIAGPLHASVNYAQYPMMSFAPSVSGVAYLPPPTADSPDQSPLAWMPPLDVGLYQASFTYLLSSVQYDTLGVYSFDPRAPYFADPRADLAATEMVSELMIAELTIRRRNEWRAFPYLFQLPTRVPNSISI